MRKAETRIDCISQINDEQHRKKVIKGSFYCDQLKKQYKNADRMCEHFAACYIKGVQDKFYNVAYNDHLTGA